MRREKPVEASFAQSSWLAVGLLAVAVAVGAADGRDFAGFYAARNVVDVGDDVVLTFAARVFNYSGTTVEDATVSLGDRLALDPPYGTFVITSVALGGSVRIDFEATLPRAEYDAWQAGTASPRLTITYLDGDGNPRIRTIELTRPLLEE